MAKLTTLGFGQILVEAGVLTQEELGQATRIVIDCPADGVPQIYIQKYADESAMRKLAPMLKGLLPDE